MANEDFSTYTEVDAGADITVTSSKIDVVAMPRNLDSYVYYDKGSGFFSGDFIHQFECYCNSSSANGGMMMVWGLANGVDEGKALSIGVESIQVVMQEVSGTTYFYLYLYDGAASFNKSSIKHPQDTIFYCTVQRDDDGGGSSTGRYTLLVRTGSHSGPVIAITTIDTTAQMDFQYVYGCASWDVSNAATITGYVQNLNLSASHATASTDYEDFTTYTSTDPDSSYTFPNGNIAIASELLDPASSYVYKDKGANWITEDFEHLIELGISSEPANNSRLTFWQIADVVKTFGEIDADNTNSCAAVYTYYGSAALDRLYIVFIDADESNTDFYVDYQRDENYFVTIVRDDDGGASSKGIYTAYIRTGSHSGTLVDTITVDSATQQDYRYAFTTSSANADSGTPGAITGWAQNFDYGAAAFNITSINGVSTDTIAKILGVAIADISKINGIDLYQ